MQKKTTYKILKKAIILIVPIYFMWFLYIEYMPMYYNRANNTVWYFIKNTLNKSYEKPKTKVLFLGDSRTNAALNFKEIPNSYSFASGGASPIEMFFILEKYLKEYEKPEKIYISISPRFLSEIFAFYPYFIRNGLLSFSEMNEICSNLKEGETSLGQFPKAQFILYKLNYIEYYQADVKSNNVFGAYKTNEELIKQMFANNGGQFHGNLKEKCSDLNYETKYVHFTPSVILTKYLDKIFSVCKQKKIDVEFVFMPMNESSYNALNKTFMNEYKKYMQNLQEKYPEFLISDSMYFYSDNYFGDSSHLNLKGKMKFTKSFNLAHKL